MDGCKDFTCLIPMRTVWGVAEFFRLIFSFLTAENVIFSFLSKENVVFSSSYRQRKRLEHLKFLDEALEREWGKDDEESIKKQIKEIEGKFSGKHWARQLSWMEVAIAGAMITSLTLIVSGAIFFVSHILSEYILRENGWEQGGVLALELRVLIIGILLFLIIVLSAPILLDWPGSKAPDTRKKKKKWGKH